MNQTIKKMFNFKNKFLFLGFLIIALVAVYLSINFNIILPKLTWGGAVLAQGELPSVGLGQSCTPTANCIPPGECIGNYCALPYVGLGKDCNPDKNRCLYGQCLLNTSLNKKVCTECMGTGASCYSGGTICCPGSSCAGGVCKSDSPVVSNCRQIGASCSTEADCCSKVCVNNKCASCETYCQDNNYDGSACLDLSNSGSPFNSYFNSSCDINGACNYFNVESPKDRAPNEYCAQTKTYNCDCPECKGKTGLELEQCFSDCSKKSGGCSVASITNLGCYCYDNKQTACSPYCDLKCSRSGCQPLATGFLGCKQGADYNSRICSWNLAQGANLISLPVSPNKQGVTNILESIRGKFSAVHTYDNNNSQWLNFYTANSSKNNLDTLTPDKGYLIQMKESAVLTIEGKTINSAEVSTEWFNGLRNNLPVGWNLVGVPFERGAVWIYGYNMPDVNSIYWLKWGASGSQSEDWLYYLPKTITGALDKIEPGKGYWIFKAGLNSQCFKEKCGKGLFNICDQKECEGLGGCYFKANAIGGDCLTKCDYDDDCAKQITCPQGQFAACGQDNKCLCQDTCVDSDSGRDYFHTGTAGGQKDTCESAAMLKEYYCEKNRVAFESKKCDFGCVGGFCRQACSDSDGGKMFYTFGQATNGETTVTDKCSDDNKTLSEGYCESNGQLALSPFSFTCAFGCQSGVCFRDVAKTTNIRFAILYRGGQQEYTPLQGVKIYVKEQGSSSVVGSCLSSSFSDSGAACSIFLPAKKYTAYIQDPLFTCNSADCPKDFEFDGTRDVTVSLVAGLIKPQSDYCHDTDGGKNTAEIGAVKVWKNSLSVLMSFVDYCNGQSVVEYYCSVNAVKSETVRCDRGSCYQGACTKDCSGFGAGYRCVKEEALAGMCADKDVKKMPEGEYCSGAGGNYCAKCAQSCGSEYACMLYTCGSGYWPKCGADQKCFCEPTQVCSADAGCLNFQCPGGQRPVCRTQLYKGCYCVNITQDKRILVHVDDDYTDEDIRGVEVKILDRKQGDKQVASCTTDEDRAPRREPRGKCTIAAITFSADHEYIASVVGVSGYQDMEIPLTQQDNYDFISANFHLKSDSSSITECAHSSDCADYGCRDNQYGACYHGRCECRNYNGDPPVRGCTVDTDCSNLNCTQPDTAPFCNSNKACECKPDATNKVEYSIVLYPGENLIASPVDELLTLSEVKKNCNVSQGFIVYLPDNAAAGTVAFIGTDFISPQQGASITVINQCTVIKEGTPINYLTRVAKGWNLMSVSGPYSLNESKGNCEISEAATVSGGNRKSVGLTEKLSPMQGYWVNVKEQCRFSK